MGCFVLRQIQLTRAVASGGGVKPTPLIPRSLLSIECWDLMVLYVAAACAWAATDVSFPLAPGTRFGLTADFLGFDRLPLP